ncbi:hypothetical protein P7K49_027242 [Saguinus oedipus]|uniref:Uncharacterized protein n=1 Tax=Saguinus oedipus TaxID=9490 RepID=A0ABQ9U9N9_SAGOE|nr:hypothetical protein P7K49_027242 [Saguinus oedipus]
MHPEEAPGRARPGRDCRLQAIYEGSTPAQAGEIAFQPRASHALKPRVAWLPRHVLGGEALGKGPCFKSLRTVDWVPAESEPPGPRLARLLAERVAVARIPIQGLYLNRRRQDAGFAGVGAAWAPKLRFATARTVPSPGSAGPGRRSLKSGLRSRARDRGVAATAQAVEAVPAGPGAQRPRTKGGAVPRGGDAALRVRWAAGGGAHSPCGGEPWTSRSAESPGTSNAALSTDAASSSAASAQPAPVMPTARSAAPAGPPRPARRCSATAARSPVIAPSAAVTAA